MRSLGSLLVSMDPDGKVWLQTIVHHARICLGLSTVTIYTRFTAAVIRYPVPYRRRSFGISLMAISYTGMSSSNIFPLSCAVLGCSVHFARLVAHVTPLPAKRPSIYSIWYGVQVKPIPYHWAFWGIQFTAVNCTAATVYGTVDSPRYVQWKGGSHVRDRLQDDRIRKVDSKKLCYVSSHPSFRIVVWWAESAKTSLKF
jgi:hypothetical protein